jgi:prophage tail gpP-like protein
LSTTFKTQGGESWGDIARQTTGDDLDSAAIQRANPGQRAPLPAGVVVQIPGNTGAFKKRLTKDGFELLINGNSIGTIDGVSIASSIDAISKIGFSVPNEGATRALFPPLSSSGILAGYNRQTAFTGVTESPRTAADVITVGGYSFPGTLEESTAPASAFPLEFKDLNLREIVQQVVEPLSVNFTFDGSPGARFSKVDIKQTDKILPFLSGLALQRGFVISDDPEGNLIFWKGKETGQTILDLDENNQPIIGFPQVVIEEKKYFSSVTGIIPAKSKGKKPGERFTVENPAKTSIVRPFNFEAKDIDEGELETVVNAKAARMFADVVSVVVNLATVTDKSGNLIEKNQLVSLFSPKNNINTPYDFLIKDVVLNFEADRKTSQLKLVMPGVYSGKIPEFFPWE